MMLILPENPLTILLMYKLLLNKRFSVILIIGLIFINPLQADNFYEEAITKFEKEDYSSSIKSLEKSVVFEPKNFDSWVLLGKSYFAIENNDLAKKYYEIAYTLTPDNLELNFLLGEVSYKLNLIEGYTEYLTNLETLCPSGCDEFIELKELSSS